MTLAPGNPMTKVLSAVLMCEALVFGLTIPGMIQVSDRSVAVAFGTGGAAIVIALLGAALVRRGRVGYLLGWLSQVVGIALGFGTPYQFVMGVVFAVVWSVTFGLGKRLERPSA